MYYSNKRDRVPLGNYPKWMGYLIRWGLSRYLPAGSSLLLRGRGRRRKNGQWIGKATRYGLPLQQATRVGIYLIRTNPYYHQQP